MRASTRRCGTCRPAQRSTRCDDRRGLHDVVAFFSRSHGVPLDVNWVYLIFIVHAIRICTVVVRSVAMEGRSSLVRGCPVGTGRDGPQHHPSHCRRPPPGGTDTDRGPGPRVSTHRPLRANILDPDPGTGGGRRPVPTHRRRHARPPPQGADPPRRAGSQRTRTALPGRILRCRHADPAAVRTRGACASTPSPAGTSDPRSPRRRAIRLNVRPHVAGAQVRHPNSGPTAG